MAELFGNQAVVRVGQLRIRARVGKGEIGKVKDAREVSFLGANGCFNRRASGSVSNLALPVPIVAIRTAYPPSVSEVGYKPGYMAFFVLVTIYHHLHLGKMHLCFFQQYP
jgi:hypothetical protein